MSGCLGEPVHLHLRPLTHERRKKEKKRCLLPVKIENNLPYVMIV